MTKLRFLAELKKGFGCCDLFWGLKGPYGHYLGLFILTRQVFINIILLLVHFVCNNYHS